MTHIVFAIAFCASIFCVSREYVDWCTLPTTAAAVTVLSWASAWVIGMKREILISAPCLVAFGAFIGLYAWEGSVYLSYYIPLAGTLALFFFIEDNSGKGHFAWVARAVPLVLLAEAATGIAQFARTGESLRMTGHFDNPFGFSLCLAFGIPFLLYLIRTGERRTRRWAIAGVAATLTTIGLAGSRATLLCAGIVIAFQFRRSLAEKWRKAKRWKQATIVLSMVAGMAGAYWVKADSANGRLLIWGTACRMISERPWGFGPEGTHREYMNYQAQFLEKIEDPYWLNLADNVTYVFSEYLEAGISFGVAGAGAALWALAATCGRLRKAQEEEERALAGLLFTVLFPGLFSYPLHYPMSWVATGYAASQLLRPKRGNLRTSPAFVARWAAMSVILLFLLRQEEELQTQREWFRCGMAALSGDREAVERDYPRLYPRLRHYPPFLYNYGAELYYAGQFERSDAILREYSARTADYDAWVLTGEARRATGRHEEAVAAFRKAAAMCPGRLYPLYGEMETYRDAGMTEEARKTAETIMRNPVKTHTPVTEGIIQEAQALLNEHQQNNEKRQEPWKKLFFTLFAP